MDLESVIHQGIQKVRVGKKKTKANQEKKNLTAILSVCGLAKFKGLRVPQVGQVRA